MKSSGKIIEFKLLPEGEELLWVANPIKASMNIYPLIISLFIGLFLILVGLVAPIFVPIFRYVSIMVFIMTLFTWIGRTIPRQYGYSNTSLYIRKFLGEKKIGFEEIGDVKIKTIKNARSIIVIYGKDKKNELAYLKDVDKKKTVVKALLHSISEFNK